jgi:hypothetical protein
MPSRGQYNHFRNSRRNARLHTNGKCSSYTIGWIAEKIKCEVDSSIEFPPREVIWGRLSSRYQNGIFRLLLRLRAEVVGITGMPGFPGCYPG